MTDIVEQTRQFMTDTLKGAEGGHDHLHCEHVERIAVHIFQREDNGASLEKVQCGALLHDIADAKFHNGDEEIGPKTAYDFLKAAGMSEEFCDDVANIVRHISFKGSFEGQQWMSPELAIVQDADRLTGMGAVGIARTFNYGGHNGRAIYDPDIPVQENMTKEKYKASTAPTINHFYEKLLLLKDRMNTKTGRKMAEERHRYMEHFLEQFYAEWNGER